MIIELNIGDRVRHMDGREGTISTINGIDDVALISVTMDSGGMEVEPIGYWEKIPEAFAS